MNASGIPSLDTRGELCPQPIIDLARKLRSMPEGATLEVVSDDLAFPPDLEAWCAGTGNEVLDLSTEGRVHRARVRKRSR
jgi:tRNA 2-thiouridine synthesizing protein A